MYWVHSSLQVYRLNTAGKWITKKTVIFMFIDMLQNHNGQIEMSYNISLDSL